MQNFLLHCARRNRDSYLLPGSNFRIRVAWAMILKVREKKGRKITGIFQKKLWFRKNYDFVSPKKNQNDKNVLLKMKKLLWNMAKFVKLLTTNPNRNSTWTKVSVLTYLGLWFQNPKSKIKTRCSKSFGFATACFLSRPSLLPNYD